MKTPWYLKDIWFAIVMVVLSGVLMFPWPQPDRSELVEITGVVTEVRQSDSLSRRARGGIIYKVFDGEENQTLRLNYVVKREDPEIRVDDEVRCLLNGGRFVSGHQAVELFINGEAIVTYEQYKQRHWETGFWCGVVGIGFVVLIVGIPRLMKSLKRK